jgi:uncharacterized membrane protein YeaQ/YmgE (transglycosylase-associated protein family)
MDTTAIIIMVVIGAIAGWLASLVVGGPWGLIGYIIAGVIGGVVGGWLLNMLKVDLKLGNPVVNQIVTAAIGAMSLLSWHAISRSEIDANSAWKLEVGEHGFCRRATVERASERWMSRPYPLPQAGKRQVVVGCRWGT